MTKTIDQQTEAYELARDMNAIALTRIPEIGFVADDIKMVKLPIVRPGPNDVAIKLRASSLRTHEVYAAQGTAFGRFLGPRVADKINPHVLGSSVSGVVVGVGAEVKHFSPGDEVIVIPRETTESGSWADYRCVDQKWVMPKPASLSHVEAAGMTMAACLAWGAIGLGRPQSGHRCLVVGAYGAIGIMIVQYLKTLGCNVTAVCRNSNAPLVRELGADDVIDLAEQSFADLLVSREEYYDRVFDCIGGRGIERDSFRVLKRDGVFETVIGPKPFIGDDKLSRWELTILASYVFLRTLISRFRGPHYTFGEKSPRSCIQAALKRIVDYQLRLPIARTIPFKLEAVVDAVNLITTHKANGRIVIDFQ